MNKLLTALFCVALPVGAQNSKPTERPPELWGHHIGETVTEFLVGENMTLATYCAKALPPDEELTAEALGAGWPCTKSSDLTTKGSINLATLDVGHLRTTGLLSANFDKGVVTSIEGNAGIFDRAVSDMSDKFGKPTTLKYVTLENGFGATWTEGRAEWVLGDIHITINEEKPTGAPVMMFKEEAK